MAIAAAIGPAAPSAEQARSPLAFVQWLYASFDNGGTGIHPTAENASRYFDPALVRLIRADRRQARGEVPLLNDNPLCECQDSDDVRYTITVDRPTRRASATARVKFRSAGEVKRIVLDLKLTPTGWRIADVHSPGRPSLKRTLASGLHAARRD